MNSTGPISPLLKTVLSGGLALSAMLSAMSPSGAEVGVTAAVNVDARGRPPGGAPRVLALGASIVHNERVTTDGQGLVQILLIDGTTFTVGPNSDLTIDEFVYNPETGDARVVASLTKGVFRFVGARTSQTEGGATVKTPVGTIGIRGAVSNVSYDPATGETKASLVAGNGLTITDNDGTRRIVYETGYTAVITKGEGGGTTTTIRKSTPAETRVFQQQVSGKPGQNGGNTGAPPSDEQTEQVAETNSGLPDMMWLPPLKPVQSSEPDQVEETAGIDGKTQDDLNNDIGDETHTVTGFFSGMGQSNVYGEGSYALTSAPIYCEGADCDGESNFTVRINGAGDPVSGEGLLEDSQQEYYTGQNPVVSKLLVRFAGGQTELFDEEGNSHAGQSQNYIVSGRTTAVDNVVYEHCTECDFIEWGWWGTEVATDASQGVPEPRVDRVVNGTWVAGNITSAAAVDPEVVLNESALPFGGSAEYNGTAIGTVSRVGDPTYVATGDFNMIYNFAGRSGEASINNFDGNDDYDVSGYVFDYSNETQALFAGQIEGYDPSTDSYVSGGIQGAFVNDGPNVAAGAIGNFAFSGSGVNVVGTVAGVGSAHNP